MSYWVSLHDDKDELVEVERYTEGGTYAIGGTTQADLNVTYNYSKLFSVKTELDGQMASRVIPMLEMVIAEFGTEQDEDYWKVTTGNVGHMLSILLRWAKQYPNAHFHVN